MISRLFLKFFKAADRRENFSALNFLKKQKAKHVKILVSKKKTIWKYGLFSCFILYVLYVCVFYGEFVKFIGWKSIKNAKISGFTVKNCEFLSKFVKCVQFCLLFSNFIVCAFLPKTVVFFLRKARNLFNCVTFKFFQKFCFFKRESSFIINDNVVNNFNAV